MLTKEKRDELVAKIRCEMQTWYDLQPEKQSIGGYCLWWAVFTVRVLRQANINAQLQAGTAYWRRMRDDQDDGITPLEFGYEFGADKQALMRAMLAGTLPEMHVWAAVADPKDQQIIDLTTRYWPEQANHILGIDWPGDLPPDYMWASSAHWPAGCRYLADRQAIGFVYHLLEAVADGSTMMRVIHL